MTKIQYTQAQREELLSNKYVKNCSEKYITFTKECKQELLRQVGEGIFYRDIFRNLGFPEYIVGSKTPEKCYNRWKKKALSGSLEDEKGRKRKEYHDLDSMSLEEQNEYLKAKVAYLEEVQKYFQDGVP